MLIMFIRLSNQFGYALCFWESGHYVTELRKFVYFDTDIQLLKIE